MSATATPLAPVPAVPSMTADEFLAMHGDESNVELVKGRIVRYPMPGPKHGMVCNKAAFLITRHVLEHDLGRVMSNDTFVRTGEEMDTIRGADLCFLSYARLPKHQALPEKILVSPDLVVEVRSPTDRMNQMMSKAYEYLDAKVVVVLLLFPETQSARILRNEDESVRLGSDDELTLPDVLPGFAIRVAAFFE